MFTNTSHASVPAVHCRLESILDDLYLENIYELIQLTLHTPPRVSLEPNTGLDIVRTIWLNLQHSMEYPSIDSFWYLEHEALCGIIRRR
jgi:hypothetical protein